VLPDTRISPIVSNGPRSDPSQPDKGGEKDKKDEDKDK
jgi:hypothetical protein